MEQPIVHSSAPYTAADILTIYTGRAGQWACSPSFIERKLIASAQIALTGSRRNDYKAAEKLTHVQHAPGVTVWHHVYNFNPLTDECTMQLVNWDHHLGTIPHTGGCKQYAEHHGRRYRQTPPEKELPPLVSDIPVYSAKKLEEFSLRTGLNLPPDLRRFYSGTFRLNRDALAHAAQQDFHLDAVLPLWDQEGISVEAICQVLKKRVGAAPLDKVTVVGVDACGNFFCTNENGALLFYDHEEDQCFAVDVSLKDLAE